jgi:hypothetical protein
MLHHLIQTMGGNPNDDSKVPCFLPVYRTAVSIIFAIS